MLPPSNMVSTGLKMGFRFRFACCARSMGYCCKEVEEAKELQGNSDIARTGSVERGQEMPFSCHRRPTL